MASPTLRLTGVELYFADLQRAQHFYEEILGLKLADMQPGHHAKFMTPGGFICIERRGSEDYPSADKAVLFLEVPSLSHALERIGSSRVIKRGSDSRGKWAVLHDPEGHNVLLIEAAPSQSGLARNPRA
jgi:predicted enzyme related to lactoylglutathione lyase